MNLETVLTDSQQSLKIHLVGVGGDGMSSLAGLLIDQGHELVGTQQGLEKVKQPSILMQLRDQGARIHLRHGADLVDPDAVLLIRSSAVEHNHVELEEARRRGIPILKRSQALGKLMSRHEKNVAVAGTAGKTTTSAMIGSILLSAGTDPSFSFGSPLITTKKNFRNGSGKFFICEADEFDNSFLDLRYSQAIITEFFFGDHIDFYSDEKDLFSSFSSFVQFEQNNGVVIGYGDNSTIRDLCKRAESAEFLSYGFRPENDLVIFDTKFTSEQTDFSVYDTRTNKSHPFTLRLHGRHNIANATAAIASATALGIDLDSIASTLADFAGTERRLQLLGKNSRGMHIIDDYAHNPVQIKASVSAVKQRFPVNRIGVVFEPRQYKRTKYMMKQLPDAFKEVDYTLILDISDGIGDIAGSKHDIHSTDIVELMKHSGQKSEYCSSRSNVPLHLSNLADINDTIITMGTGRLTELALTLLKI